MARVTIRREAGFDGVPDQLLDRMEETDSRRTQETSMMAAAAFENRGLSVAVCASTRAHAQVLAATAKLSVQARRVLSGAVPELFCPGGSIGSGWLKRVATAAATTTDADSGTSPGTAETADYEDDHVLFASMPDEATLTTVGGVCFAGALKKVDARVQVECVGCCAEPRLWAIVASCPEQGLVPVTLAYVLLLPASLADTETSKRSRNTAAGTHVKRENVSADHQLTVNVAAADLARVSAAQKAEIDDITQQLAALLVDTPVKV